VFENVRITIDIIDQKGGNSFVTPLCSQWKALFSWDYPTEIEIYKYTEYVQQPAENEMESHSILRVLTADRSLDDRLWKK